MTRVYPCHDRCPPVEYKLSYDFPDEADWRIKRDAMLAALAASEEYHGDPLFGDKGMDQLIEFLEWQKHFGGKRGWMDGMKGTADEQLP